jgi:hypothetical protein
MEEKKREGLDRRTFLQRAALTGAAAAWATPIVQTVTASPAFANAGTVRECGHSFGQAVGACNERSDQGCMGACQQVCHPENCDTLSAQQNECNQVCGQVCPNRNSDDPVRNQTCCDVGVCDTSNWTCVNGQACYTGPLGGIPGVTGFCPTATPICST